MTQYLGDKLISGVAYPTEPTRNLGQIIPSTIPLTDAGLHLLDGSLILGGGIYSAFVDYIAGLVSTYPDLFETEANWQSAVTTYGVCGKFVYDSIANTVRLPKITGILEGTTDVTALGDLVEAGLPNITGNHANVYNSDYKSGCFDNSYYGSGAKAATVGSNYSMLVFDASLSNSIYGNSTTVQPQTIKALYYIVIATTTKTEIEVDIDQIATDLNGKADVDLTNVNNAGTSRGASWAMPSDTYDELTVGASGTTYTAPANGWVLFKKSCTATTQFVALDGSIISAKSVPGSASYTAQVYIPVIKNEVFKIVYDAAGNNISQLRFIYAVGSESEAA